MVFIVEIIFVILFCWLLRMNYACVATRSTSTASSATATTSTTAAVITTTTTTPSIIITTTTAVTTTTTAANLACASCTANQITFTPGDIAQGTETPTSTGPTTGADGCVTLVVTCPATNNGIVFMQFNTNIGGPIDPAGGAVEATLTCVNGNWEYTQNGVTITVTEVNCVAA